MFNNRLIDNVDIVRQYHKSSDTLNMTTEGSEHPLHIRNHMLSVNVKDFFLLSDLRAVILNSTEINTEPWNYSNFTRATN